MLTPPVTSTVPSFNSIAVRASRAVCKLPVPDGRHLAIYTWKLDANFWLMENF